MAKRTAKKCQAKGCKNTPGSEYASTGYCGRHQNHVKSGNNEVQSALETLKAAGLNVSSVTADLDVQERVAQLEDIPFTRTQKKIFDGWNVGLDVKEYMADHTDLSDRSFQTLTRAITETDASDPVGVYVDLDEKHPGAINELCGFIDTFPKSNLESEAMTVEDFAHWARPRERREVQGMLESLKNPSPLKRKVLRLDVFESHFATSSAANPFDYDYDRVFADNLYTKLTPQEMEQATGFTHKEIDEISKASHKEDFDYPDYGGLPKSISQRLSGDAVDDIQTSGSITPSRLTKSLLIASSDRWEDL